MSDTDTDISGDDLAPKTPSSAPAREKVESLKGVAQDYAGVVGGWASDQADRARRTVVERPLTAAGVSVGAAFAAGLVIGLLLGRPAPPPSLAERVLHLGRG